jgi:peptidoglycan/LPS O-acetylase OafA/YrhL
MIERKYELDWLRVAVILAVFFYHTLRFFDPDAWNVKNAVLHPWLGYVTRVFQIWGMPLMFVIAGAGIYYSLGRRGAAVFLKDRARRLLIPLAVGIFTHVAWQVYLERLGEGTFKGSFIAFYPRYFDGLYGFGGNFAWMGLHLWFLEMLFVFSLVFLPLFAWLRRARSGQKALARLAGALAFPGGIYLLAVPVALALALPDPGSPWTARVFGGWSFVGYAPLFLAGFLLYSDDRLPDQAGRLRWISFFAALAATAWLVARFARLGEPVYGTAHYLSLMTTFGLSAWLWILAVLGFGARRLRFARPSLLCLNEAVLPFYVIHQSVLLTVGFVVVRWAIPDLAKWAVIAAFSLAGCALIYEFAIRRFNAMRFLFGMRPRRRGGEVST